jgi:hypothetical protein
MQVPLLEGITLWDTQDGYQMGDGGVNRVFQWVPETDFGLTYDGPDAILR